MIGRQLLLKPVLPAHRRFRFGIMDEENDLAGILNKLCHPLCRLSCRREVVGLHRRHQALIIAPGIKGHNRDITFCRQIELHLARLGVRNGDRNRRRIPGKLLIQNIHLLVYTIRRPRRAVCHLHLILAFIPKVLIDIVYRLQGSLLHFVPVGLSLRLADHGQRRPFWKLEPHHIIVCRRADHIQLLLVFLLFLIRLIFSCILCLNLWLICSVCIFWSSTRTRAHRRADYDSHDTA